MQMNFTRLHMLGPYNVHHGRITNDFGSPTARGVPTMHEMSRDTRQIRNITVISQSEQGRAIHIAYQRTVKMKGNMRRRAAQGRGKQHPGYTIEPYLTRRGTNEERTLQTGMSDAGHMTAQGRTPLSTNQKTNIDEVSGKGKGSTALPVKTTGGYRKKQRLCNADSDGVPARSTVVEFQASVKSNKIEPVDPKSQSYRDSVLYDISCDENYSIVDALKAHETFIKTNPNFNYDYIFLEVRGDNDNESYIPNIGCPVKLFEGKTVICDVKTKIKTKPSDYCRAISPEDCAKIGGIILISMKSEHVRGKITYMDGSHYKNSLLAVTFLKDESLREALTKDGRFQPNVIGGSVLKSVKNKEAAISLNVLASTYKDKILYILWDGKVGKSSTETTAEEKSNDSTNDPCTSQFSPDALENLGKIEDMCPIISESYKSLDFSNDGKSNEKAVMKLLAKPFSSTNETLSVATINMYQKSTGIIYIDRDGEKSGIGTGFFLKFPHVLTNNHVINDINRKAGVDPVKICFNYTKGTIDSQEHSQKYSFKRKNNAFLIHFSSPIDELDYVILEVELEDRMDTDDGQSADKFPALAERINCFPKDKSALSIIGHPGGRVLQIDPRCSLMLKKLKHIPVYFKLESIDEKQARRALSEDHIPYDTSMFEGSSGSPVFNPQGHLVAVHTRGLFRKGALRSAFEQGVALTSIMNNVKLQAKDEVQKEIMSRIFPERLFEVVAHDRQPAPASMASPE